MSSTKKTQLNYTKKPMTTSNKRKNLENKFDKFGSVDDDIEEPNFEEIKERNDNIGSDSEYESCLEDSDLEDEEFDEKCSCEIVKEFGGTYYGKSKDIASKCNASGPQKCCLRNRTRTNDEVVVKHTNYRYGTYETAEDFARELLECPAEKRFFHEILVADEPQRLFTPRFAIWTAISPFQASSTPSTKR